jgi:formyltetrahydrofolate hydrolase
MRNTAVLLIACPDKKGLVAAIANFLYAHNANILHADQHQDDAAGLFLMRVEWALEGFQPRPAQVRRSLRADRGGKSDDLEPVAVLR